jgi:Caspase domain
MAASGGTTIASNVLVGIGIGAYEHLKPLPRARSDVQAVAEAFRLAGFSSATTFDQPRDAVVSAIHDALPADGLGRPGTALVVLWAGHATQNLETGSLRLLTSSNRPDDPDLMVITAEGLAEIAARSGASQLLLLIDSCRSGRAVVDVARVVDAIQRKLPDRRHRWVGIVASCQLTYV